MTERQYARLSEPFRGGRREKELIRFNQWITTGCYGLYPALLTYLLVAHMERLPKAILVPGISFIILSLVRKRINRPRPYERMEIDPIIHKDTKGKSMPSRHVFSIFVIAMTFLWTIPPVGVLLLVLGTLLAGIRVVGGVHYPSDVCVGAACGIVAGVVGFWLIP